MKKKRNLLTGFIHKKTKITGNCLFKSNTLFMDKATKMLSSYYKLVIMQTLVIIQKYNQINNYKKKKKLSTIIITSHNPQSAKQMAFKRLQLRVIAFLSIQLRAVENQGLCNLTVIRFA